MAPGAKSKFGDPYSKLRSFGSVCSILKEVLVTLLGFWGAWDFSASPQPLGTPCTDLANP